MYKAISCLQKVHPVLSATRTFSYRFPRGIWVYLLSVQKNSTFSIEPLKHWRNKGQVFALAKQSHSSPATGKFCCHYLCTYFRKPIVLQPWML